MSWTYTNDPANVQRDELRLLIGDIDDSDPQLTDEELDYYLAEEGNVAGAAVAAVRGLIALYSRQADKAVGDLRLSYSQRSKGYQTLLKELQARRSARIAGPFAGGISKSRKKTVHDDSDRVQAHFRRGLFRYPGSTVGPDDDDDRTR